VNQQVRDYLIRAHNKVIAHYHQVLGASSLTDPERKRIQQGLAQTETELAALSRYGHHVDSFSANFAQGDTRMHFNARFRTAAA
jgi:hypothetical protein